MKNLKNLMLVLLAVMMLFAFCACGAEAKYTITEGKLTMGTNAEFPPFESKEGTGFTGVDIDLMEAIAKKLNMELVIVDTEFDSLPEYLTNGQIDVIAAALSARADREEKMDFSNEYYDAEQMIIVKTDSDVTDKTGLSGKKIGVQAGTTGVSVAKSVTDEDKVVEYPSGALAVAALLGGDIEAVIIDNAPATVYVEQNDGLTLITGQFDVEKYVFGITKGNTKLLEKINKALDELKADGTYTTIMEKYFGK